MSAPRWPRYASNWRLKMWVYFRFSAKCLRTREEQIFCSSLEAAKGELFAVWRHRIVHWNVFKAVNSNEVEQDDFYICKITCCQKFDCSMVSLSIQTNLGTR
ncbi:hypothetical protein A3K71_06380 [archaeon RBG_16_50_20]|nr:MAG: hypothetical protein A3K71_06380 [archaeon RBG_16_50_20]